MFGMHDTVTIWNKWRNPATVKDEWYRHVVTSCAWSSEIMAQPSGTGAVVGSAYSLLIAEHPDYLPPREWVDTMTNKQLHFTLRPGDLIALGVVARDISSTAPNTEVQVKTDLAPDVFTVKAVADLSAEHKQARHYEVAGV